MKKIIEIRKEAMFSDNHLVKTTNGWIKAKDLKKGDEVFDFNGKVEKITKIFGCEKRPDAPIVGKI